MSRHHSERQQPPAEPALALPSTDPSTANAPVPPSFDPALASPPPPPASAGDPDSAKAAKNAPAPDPSSPPVDPLSPPPPTPTDPNNTPKPPAADPPPSPPPASTALPSPEHSKHPSDPPTNPHDGALPADAPLPGSPPSSSPSSAGSPAPESPSPPPATPGQPSSSSPSAPPPSTPTTTTTTTTTTNKHPSQASPAQSDLPVSQPVAGAVNATAIDQSVAAKSPDSAASRAAHPQQNSRSDDSTGTHVGTIMGILLAAVVGALILVGVLGMIKRKRRARQNQADFHQDIFQEKNSFEPDMDRKSLGSASLGIPMSPDGNRSFNPRSDGIFAPRPPSIIERHQASPVIPGPMPSYQPGQMLNYSAYPPQQQQQQSFNLHRPKPPTYHCGFPEKSGLAYANNPPIERSLSPRTIPHDQNNVTIEMSHQDPSQPNRYEYHGTGQHIPMQNMLGYGSGAGSGYAGTGGPVSPTPNYQQQVDQLDFLGQPSPALTMVGPLTTDWGQGGEAGEKKTDAAGGAAEVAMDSERSGTPMIPNLQQSYLDCDSRVSERSSPNDDHPPHPAPAPADAPGFAHPAPISLADDWKLACPNPASPLGEIFAHHDPYLAPAPVDLHQLPAQLHQPADIDADRQASHSPLKVINP
ncbi:hypothetical protein, variant [Puccinia triticina 1-1 BBBD Race 1]|uniref:Uncharacterized protein n=1 Tax=Puccinia triticina (isolate 1-1 / race 1 (BBBD)) TaxID=630390 RepID=A0A180GPK8_PUCT1|nr:hypothetical protein, variant [Puccinia triticina 1-1 BBBD Race 1]